MNMKYEAIKNTEQELLPREVRNLVPVPQSIDDTGLSVHFHAELASKHLFDAGVLTIKRLSERLGLPGTIVEQVLNFLKAEARVEVLPLQQRGGLRFGLTQKGSQLAQEALYKSGYIGPAPLPLARYVELVNAQSIHHYGVTREDIQRLFADIAISDSILEQVGPALNSGRAIFVYGHAGTGKTYITQKLVAVFADHCLIPFAIMVNDTVVSIFDPALHQAIEEDAPASNLLFANRHDPRLLLCKRPVLISGGELTLDMLDIRYAANAREYHPSLQLKANNGIFIIDDMGRQQASPMAIFNRWIVPLEERRDFLTLGAGRHFEVPFDQVLVFSSNINPLELADEAFLRRIGYKIHFESPSVREFTYIWWQECEKLGLTATPELLQYLLQQHYVRERKALLPCHPRDLLGIAKDLLVYEDSEPVLSREKLDAAWRSYFVELADLPLVPPASIAAEPLTSTVTESMS
ncbi:MAG: AAA family ATPase [Pseudomonadales bacterium]